MTTRTTKSNKDNGVQIPFNTPEFIEAWAEWLQYRKERKLTAYTPTGIKRTFNGLVRDSGNNQNTAIAMIHYAMEKSWQGLFPIPKSYNNGQATKQPITNDKLKDALTERLEQWKQNSGQ